MNKIIKFRVWSKIKNTWLNSIVLTDKGTPLVFYVEINDKQEIINKVFTLDEFDPIIQQFTGLKDNNGKEIWEGDIIKQTIEKSPLSKYNTELKDNEKFCIRPIVWGNYSDGEYVEKIECWMFGDICSISELIHRTSYDDGYWTRKYEIIGNIFENTELLK